MLLSVVIPVFNAEKTIKQCVSKVLNQPDERIELILINDGSTDNSLDLCHEIALSDSRVIVKNQENKGPIAARKNGVNKARGDYVMFIDADDFISDDAISTVFKYLEENRNLDIIQFNYIMIDIEGNPKEKVNSNFSTGKYDKKALRELIYPQMIYYDSFYNFGIMPSLGNKVFKRSLVEKYIPGVPEDIFFGEDGLVTYQCFFNAEIILIVDDYLYFYRKSPDSICRGLNKKRDKLVQNNSLIKAFEKTVLLSEPEYETQFANYVVYMTWLGIKESLLKKIKYPEDKIDLKFIKSRITFDYKYYVKKQQWKKITKKNRLLLYMVSHKMMRALYLYVRYQYKRATYV